MSTEHPTKKEHNEHAKPEGATAAVSEAAGHAAETAKSFAARAGEAVSGAASSAAAIIKEHPVTSAAVAAGAAAAVAGAVYGAGALGGSDDEGQQTRADNRKG